MSTTQREKVVTERHVEEKRNTFIAAGYEQKRVGHQSWISWSKIVTTGLPYFLLPPSLYPEIPNFTFLMATNYYLENPDGADESELLVGISSDVPEEFREYVLYHEAAYATGRLDSLDASIREMWNVEAVMGREKIPEYVLMRHDTFAAMCALARENEKFAHRRKEWELALGYWKLICQEYGV